MSCLPFGLNVTDVFLIWFLWKSGKRKEKIIEDNGHNDSGEYKLHNWDIAVDRIHRGKRQKAKIKSK
jgi:hypothetical protein